MVSSVAMGSARAAETCRRSKADLYGGPANIYVNQLDPSFPVHEFKRAGFKVETVKSRVPSSGRILHPSVRDSVFEELKMTDAVRKWDDYAKDMLYMRARVLSVTELRRAYPRIEPKQLERLKQTVIGRTP